MTPGARLQALIELLDDVMQGGAADAAASRYFRARRYIGSKDRSAIAERLYAILRRRARLDWWINRVLERSPDSPPPANRHRVVADLMFIDRWHIRDFERNFDGDRHKPAPLSRAERSLVEALDGQKLDHPDMPRWVRLEVPDWALDRLNALYGADDAPIAAFNQSAPLDLRVNRLVGSRDDAVRRLAEAGITARPTGLSPLALRVEGRPPLGTLDSFQQGLVEVQDEGSQLVALLTDARPGMSVLDYCAGAGGKTLALAAEMANKGRLVASDIDARRLERAVTRLRRAGVHNAERRALGGDNAQWFKRQAGRFDRVLVDAPCSGTGTWRRNPDMKWKLGPQDVAELTEKQRTILDAAAKLVKPGGRLVYATCSVLPEENEGSVEAFLAAHPEFRIVPLAEVWPRIAADTPPPCPGPFLRLNPAEHQTDGFFTAILEKQGMEQRGMEAAS